MKETEVVIIGAGVVGLTVAMELLNRGTDRIIIVEKEKEVGRHASGRNSGILHAGVYYTPDSLKAKSCLNGNVLMKEYCRRKKLPLVKSGKLIVAKKEEELETLKELANRARRNGANIELVGEREAREIEPSARTVKHALWVKDTAAVDPLTILKSLIKDLTDTGHVEVLFNCPFQDVTNSREIVTNRGRIKFKYLVNTAGSYSDRVAHCFGLAKEYRIVPFKGIYWKLKTTSPLHASIRGNIYPVPDLKNPFLGVHFSKNCHGDVYVGPTAIPAFGREHYGVIKGIDKEAIRILMDDLMLFLKQPQFRSVALSEPLKYFKYWFFKDASQLVHGLKKEHLEFSPKAGIRPQLINVRKKQLEMDFIVKSDTNSIHVLNPISPAFTASMDLAIKICDLIEK